MQQNLVKHSEVECLFKYLQHKNLIRARFILVLQCV